jgi:hypothetical protein
MGTAPPGVRKLFRAALLIFVITVVIGILNGTDVWEVPRNTLLTHVHAGTLGWITLSVFGGAIWIFGSPDDNSSNTLANFSIVALALYVLAFWSGDILSIEETIQRPIGGTLAFIAMVWMFVWALRRKRRQSWDVAEFGLILALFFLVMGAVLGVMLGLQLAGTEIVAGENADRLGEAHPAAMVIGYVILAAVALIEWIIRKGAVPKLSESRSGMIQMLLVFLAGVLGMVGFLLGNDTLIQLNVPLEVVGLIILLVRLRSFLAPSQWGGSIVNAMPRVSVIGLVLGIGLLAYVVSLFVGGSEIEEILPFLLALDHVNFIAVVTNLIFAMMAVASDVTERANRIIFWGTNIGIAGFVAGLVSESAALKRIFTPILGLALLYGIFTHLTANEAQPTRATV